MGRVKTQTVKRVTKRLVEDHRQDFSESFEKNKAVLQRFAAVPSRKLRNAIAGHITRQIKSSAQA